jgi:hypothetical protein
MKNKLLIISLFLVGILIRIYCAFKQPLWLDEIYSLYFAHNFSPLNLIIQLPEAHPGAYYLFLKVLLCFSTNLIFLRTISSILPFLIGCYLLYRQKQSKILLFALLLNPLFIHLSWQLRMYGLTFMFSVILINLFLASSPFNHKKLLSIALLSTLFSFSLIIPVFCLYIYLSLREKKITSFLPFLFIPSEFLIIKGFSTYIGYAEYASWINSPTLTNIPTVIFTSLGFGTDVQNIGSATIMISFFFFLFFIPFIYYFSKKNRLFFYSYTLPLIVTILISVIFPFLSQHFFFYHFIPKISLFLPRFLLPMSLYFYIFVFQEIKPKLQIPLLIILFILWLIPNSKLNFHPFYINANPINYPKNSLIMPPWENLRLHSSFSNSDLNTIAQNFNIASSIESTLTNSSSNPDCTSLKQFKNIYYLVDSTITSLNNYHLKIQNLLKLCHHQVTLVLL